VGEDGLAAMADTVGTMVEPMVAEEDITVATEGIVDIMVDVDGIIAGMEDIPVIMEGIAATTGGTSGSLTTIRTGILPPTIPISRMRTQPPEYAEPE
jgi:hypothetical protein